jgi:kynurenine 3-monooxygenase
MYPDDRVKALEEYTKHRTPDAHTIVDLATGNYKEMATNVKKPLYLLRKRVEETLDYWVPGLGWKTLYERVTFGNERYAEVRRKERWQSRVLNAVLGVTGLGVIGAGLLFVRGGGLARVKMGLLRGVCWVARGLHGVGLIGGPAR